MEQGMLSLVGMKTLEEAFCKDHRCDTERFKQVVFWRTLPRHAVFFVPFLGGFNARHFAADRELLERVSRSETMNQVRRELRDYFTDSQNRGWLRTAATIRVSSRRLMRLARLYLPDPGATPPDAAQKTGL